MTRESLTREELLDWLDNLADEDIELANELRARLRTICSRCGREGADDHHDREGIYAGRWHGRCETEDDRYRANYRWTPGDEPLEEE